MIGKVLPVAEPDFIAVEMMMMVVVMHFGRLRRRLHRRAPGFGSPALGMQRTRMKPGCMMRAVTRQSCAMRAGRGTASAQTAAEMPTAAGATAAMSAHGAAATTATRVTTARVAR